MVTTRIIDSEPALIVEEKKKNLVISDLHIGFEHKFSSNKNTVRKNSSINEIISNVTKIIKKENPDTLILLGDVKSSIQSITNSEWKDVPYFFEEVKSSLEVILIPGNHDYFDASETEHMTSPHSCRWLECFEGAEERSSVLHGCYFFLFSYLECLNPSSSSGEILWLHPYPSPLDSFLNERVHFYSKSAHSWGLYHSLFFSGHNWRNQESPRIKRKTFVIQRSFEYRLI